METYSSPGWRSLLGGAQELRDVGRDPAGSAVAPETVGSASSAALTSARMRSRGGAELLEDRDDHAGVLLEQDGQQVLGGDLRVAALAPPGAGRPGAPPGS